MWRPARSSAARTGRANCSSKASCARRRPRSRPDELAPLARSTRLSRRMERMTTELLQVIASDGIEVGERVALAEDELRRMYRTMAMTRALDERAVKLQRQGRIGF